MFWMLVLFAWFVVCGFIAALVLGKTPWFKLGIQTSVFLIFVSFFAGLCLLFLAVIYT